MSHDVRLTVTIGTMSALLLAGIFLYFGFVFASEPRPLKKDGILGIPRPVPMGYESDPEVYMNASELITSKGYPCERHTVQTEDGFLLMVHRIPHGRKGTTIGQPVFLMHGLLCSSTNWLTNLANESLGFLMADAGYDVWMGNARGNTYSRRHINMTPDQSEFWDWSWQEMAAFDFPAMIDHVLSVTGHSQLHYIAHSQGTMLGFAHLSHHPEYNAKIKSFFGMGPVMHLGHTTSPLKLLVPFTREVQWIFDLLGDQEFLPSSDIIKWLAREFCDEPVYKAICGNILFVIAGYDKQQLNMTRLPVYLTHTPAGTSVKNMVHFGQLIRSNKFQMYDYGSDAKNAAHYGVPTPPVFNVSRMTAPTVLYSAIKDPLADPTDVQALVAVLSNLKASYVIQKWDHLDFIWAMDAAPVVYDKIIDAIKQWN